MTFDSINYRVRQEIRNYRLKRVYTQKDLANKISVKYWLILQYEKGGRKIPIKKLYAIAEALSVSVKDLVFGVSSFEGEEILN